MSFLSRLFGIHDPPKPIDLDPIDDSIFGRLEWNREYRHWTGRVTFSEGGEFELQVDAASDTEPLPSEGQRKSFLAIRQRLVEYRDRAIEDYLPDFNAEGVEGEPYTLKEFTAEIAPESISVECDGDVVISFNDTPNELLGGHSLTICVHSEGEVDFGLEG